MNKLVKYGGWLVGIALLVIMIVPQMILPAGITCGFALAIFTQTCAKNVSGASKVFIAEKSVATAFTITSSEISAITGTTPFMRVDVIQDSVYWNETGESVGLNNWKITNEVGFDIMPPSKDTNTFLQALIDGSPCGFFALIVDGNGKCWVVGHNATDVRNRPLILKKQDKKTGKGLGEATGNTIPIMLGNECGGLALPLDSTLTTSTLNGSGTHIKWS
jgi:hypothetical protein